MLETKRLILREYLQTDFTELYAILSDAETMKYYPKPFTKDRVLNWIKWNMENYKIMGFGLYAVILKSTGQFIGDCGITMQNINGEIKPEIGYHICMKYQNHGYATEAAIKCRDFLFANYPYDTVYSYMKYDNVPSISVAKKMNMKFVEEYQDATNGTTVVYAITKNEWNYLKKR